MQQFQGRTAFLTGAASGIGRCLAIELAQAGCNLCLVDVNSEGLKQLAAELGADGSPRVVVSVRPDQSPSCVCNRCICFAPNEQP